MRTKKWYFNQDNALKTELTEVTRVVNGCEIYEISGFDTD